jgi:hypothetical protein
MKPLYTIGETDRFVRDCRTLHLSEQEIRAIIDLVAADPFQGDEIKGKRR